MRKLLSVQEIQNSDWPGILQRSLGENLVSAFVHGDCLMEGHDAINSPWTISFILKDNSVNSLKKLQELLPKAQKENIEFLYFFTQDEINASEDVFPLEFLHLANRNQAIAGSDPLKDYAPNISCLRLECERELRGLMIHLRQAYIHLKENRSSDGFFMQATNTILPIMYGVFYLKFRNYPISHDAIFRSFPGISIPERSKTADQFVQKVDDYINAVTRIIDEVDKLDV